MTNVDQIIAKFGVYIVDPLLMMVFAAGFFLFMWGLFEFMVNVNSGQDRETGKQHMIWGTIGMFIMVSVYGIIALIDSTFGLNVGTTPNTQNVNTPNVTFTGQI